MSYTISRDDFKNIHNGKCNLRHTIERLDGIISEQVLDTLKKALSELNEGLHGVYKQEHKEFTERNNHFDKIAKEHKLKSIWSMYEIADLTALHPHVGATTVLYKDHWGESPVKVDIMGNTWVDLYRAADQCIKLSGDQHHVFIESFKASKNDHATLILSTGS